jgi:hypothetical protein
VSDEVDIFLAHYGVKGMRWGVRKDYKSTERTSLSKKQKARIAANQAKFAKKFESSEEEPEKGWRPTPKQLAIAAAGAVVVGALLYGAYKYKTGGLGGAISAAEYAKALNDTKSPFPELAGKVVSPAEYKDLVRGSVERTWGSPKGSMTANSLKQASMTFSEGHTFYRISKTAENTFGKSTFALNNEADLNRYLTAFSGSMAGKEPHIISWKATQEVRVPNLHTSLETFREVMQNEPEYKGVRLRPENVVQRFKNFNGGPIADGVGGVGDKYVAALKSKGYDGVIDYMDAGATGESPMTLFGSEKFGSKSSTLITDEIRRRAESGLTEIRNRE